MISIRTSLLGAAALFSAVAVSLAGTIIPVEQLPAPVTAVVQEYFPQSKLLKAEKDTDNGKEYFEVRIQYKDIQLEVDVSPEGKILDVDMEP